MICQLRLNSVLSLLLCFTSAIIAGGCQQAEDQVDAEANGSQTPVTSLEAAVSNQDSDPLDVDPCETVVAPEESSVQYIQEDEFADPVRMTIKIRKGRELAEVQLQNPGTSETDALLLSDEVLQPVVDKFLAAFPTDDTRAIVAELKQKIQVQPDENEPFLYVVQTSIAPSLFGAALLEQWQKELENALNGDLIAAQNEAGLLRQQAKDAEVRYEELRSQLQRHMVETDQNPVVRQMESQKAFDFVQKRELLSGLISGYAEAERACSESGDAAKQRIVRLINELEATEEASSRELKRITDALVGPVDAGESLSGTEEIRERVFELEVELAALEASYGTGHPNVRNIKSQIELWKKYLADSTGEDEEDMNSDSDFTDAPPAADSLAQVSNFFARRIAAIQRELAVVESALTGIQETQRIKDELERQLEAQEEILLPARRMAEEAIPAEPWIRDRVILLTKPAATATPAQRSEYERLRRDCPALPEFVRDGR